MMKSKSAREKRNRDLESALIRKFERKVSIHCQPALVNVLVAATEKAACTAIEAIPSSSGFICSQDATTEVGCHGYTAG
jgi:hypothetical protein